MPGSLPKLPGEGFKLCLELRNRARYEYHATISREEAEAIPELGESMIRALEDQLSQ